MKSFTDLKQSKKLAEFLPFESADMVYIDIGYSSRLLPKDDIDANTYPVIVSCWSLAALLNIIPQEIFDGEYIINITEGCDNRWVLTYDHYKNRNHSYYGLSSGADNLVDACVDLLTKLKKKNII